jgi:hypothetical protein
MVKRPFLVTGLPRIRSAWFCALFNAMGVDCIHEWGYEFNYDRAAFSHWLRASHIVGVCDPSLACAEDRTHVLEVFENKKVVIINRDPIEAQHSFEAWIGQRAPNYAALIANLESFKKELSADVLEVDFDQLDKYDAVRAVVKHCCGWVVPYRLWRRYDGLCVEQHLSKAARARSKAEA